MKHAILVEALRHVAELPLIALKVAKHLMMNVVVVVVFKSLLAHLSLSFKVVPLKESKFQSNQVQLEVGNYNQKSPVTSLVQSLQPHCAYH